MSARTKKIVVVGAGIVGLTTAYELSKRYPQIEIQILEKEKEVAMHQTGRNSGVIHSGIYYRPGSIKAKTCVEGVKRLYSFCQEHSISHNKIGKLIVAKSESEEPYLNNLYKRGIDNGLADLEILNAKEVKEIEQHVVATKGIWVPATGIVNYKEVCQKVVEITSGRNVHITYDQFLQGVTTEENQLQLHTNKGNITCDFLFNCAGLHADYIAKICKIQPKIRLIPFRGEYYSLVPEKSDLVRGLIYPVPNPLFPFLGVHLTKMIDGSVEMGPNAVLSLKKEGYTKTAFSAKDFLNTISFSGFWRFSAKHWRTGISEYHRSLSKKAFAKSVRELMPIISPHDMIFQKVGVRAQALDRKGALVDDFCFENSHRALHVINAPSPAATASFAIAAKIVDEASSFLFGST